MAITKENIKQGLRVKCIRKNHPMINCIGTVDRTDDYHGFFRWDDGNITYIHGWPLDEIAVDFELYIPDDLS